MAGNYTPVFGGLPDVPQLPPIDINKEQSKAIAANLAVAPEAEKLGAFTQQAIIRMLGAAGLDYQGMNAAISKNIFSELRGEIPADVSAAVQRESAGRSLYGGYGGTGMGHALTARDLGLTSLALTEKGLQSSERWLASTERLFAPALASMTSMFITPEMQFKADVEERDAKWQRDWLASQVAAMPDPLWRGIHDTAMSLLSAYLGGSYSGHDTSRNSLAGTGLGQSGGTMQGDGSALDMSWGGYANANPGTTINVNTGGGNYSTGVAGESGAGGFNFGGGD